MWKRNYIWGYANKNVWMPLIYSATLFISVSWSGTSRKDWDIREMAWAGRGDVWNIIGTGSHVLLNTAVADDSLHTCRQRWTRRRDVTEPMSAGRVTHALATFTCLLTGVHICSPKKGLSTPNALTEFIWNECTSDRICVINRECHEPLEFASKSLSVLITQAHCNTCIQHGDHLRLQTSWCA
jgi:hypothetical protein